MSALPAIWITSDFNRGLQNLADVLAAAVRARFVYVRVHRESGHLSEAVSTDSLHSRRGDAAGIGRELSTVINFATFEHPPTVPALGGEGPFRLATSQIAASGGIRGFIVAASVHPSFPCETDKLLLSNGAVQIAILAQRSNHDAEMLTRTAELDESNAALLETKKRLDTTLAAAEIGTWTWDVGANRVVVDANLARLFGLSADEAQGAAWDRILQRVHSEDRPELSERIELALANGRDFFAEYRVISADDSVRWVVARGRVERDNTGRAAGLPGVILDITERKNAENQLRLTRDAAEAANRAKDRFLAILSHELRTPLSPVLTTLATLEHDATFPAEFRPAIAMIRRNIELETQLIDDLLDVSRAVSGKLRLQLQPTHMHDVLQHALETCEADLTAKALVVEKSCAAAQDLVIGDPTRLQQVLWNLLRNAAKFTPAGGSIFIRTWNPAPARLAIEVRDTGVGIPPDALTRVFAPFEQGETSMTRQFGGLGLGLAICKAVMEAHGGCVRAESAGSGRGATFFVELATSLPVEPPPAAADRSPPETRIPRRNRILLVEDHVDTAKSVAWFLTRLGYAVTTAHTAASALEAAEHQGFDLMASDIGLPDISGYDLMRQMKQRFDLKGIALSGYGMEEDINRAREAGFVEHLVKPVKITQLRAVLQRVLADA